LNYAHALVCFRSAFSLAELTNLLTSKRRGEKADDRAASLPTSDQKQSQAVADAAAAEDETGFWSAVSKRVLSSIADIACVELV
jgi:hypothetical protein